MDFQWASFYPSIYAFSIWQAYDKAKTINYKLEKDGVSRPEKTTYLDEIFIGMSVGMQVGLQFVLSGSPVSGALLGGLAGVIFGFLIEKMIITKNRYKT